MPLIMFYSVPYYVATIFSSILIMMGLFLLISEKIKNKKFGILFLSAGIGIISYSITELLIYIIKH